MSIANEISKLQQNLLDCYDVCADNGAYLPEDINFDNLANCIEQISNPFNKPADWSDIRTDCPANSIALYAGHEKLDFTGYDYVVSNGKLVWANPNIYLKGDENSCILTDYAPSYKTSMDIKVGDVNNWICGARNSVGTIDFGIAYYLAAFGKNILQFTNISSGTHTFNYGQTLIKDGVTIGTFPETSSVGNVRMLLFGIRTEDNNNIQLSSGKIYYCKIYDNGTLVRHFVPVPQGLVIGNFTCPSNGMFDIVNQQFYANQGTGNFTYGGADPSNLNIKTSVQYDNLGFIANCTGGYNVFIDGTQYGTTYASGAKCDITWSTSGITTGDIITTPSLLKAHKIWIEPATEGNDITKFACARVAASGNEQQGVLWAHFNISNTVSICISFYNYQTYWQPNLFAISAKNNMLKTTGPLEGIINQLTDRGYNCSKYIQYLPVFYSQDDTTTISIQARESTSNLKTISLLGNSTYRILYHSFQDSKQLEKIKTKKQMTTQEEIYLAFSDNRSLKELPNIDYSNATNMSSFLTNAILLKDTVLDVSAATRLKKIGCYGTSTYFMSGFKGLRVPNEAPFNAITPPQINVSYTGMDRAALVQLFNDLPYNVGYTVVGSPTINNGVVSGFSSSDYLTLPSFIRNNFKQLFKIKTPNSFIAYAGLWQENTTNYKSKILFSNTGKIIVNLSSLGNSWDIADNIFSNLSLDTNKEYYIDFSYSDGYYTIKYSLDGETFNDLITPIESNSVLRTAGSIIGYNSTNNVAFNGEIDLNNTYIKVNDVYWFRGQPAMTKTLSCVGATGTANLTAEDKDIALNKNWSLTLS